MNDLPPPDSLDLDALVRLRLERDAEAIDPRPLFARIVAAKTPVARPRVRTGWKWGAAAAAAAILAALGLTFLPSSRPAQAKAEVLMRQSRQAHRLPLDRCYLVEVRRESPLVSELAPATPQVRVTRLWTRGDRFWVESTRPEQRWAWGRDDANRIWIAFGPHTAVRMDADEVPYWLEVYCDMHSLNVERFLDDVSQRFDVTRESAPADGSAATIRLHAKARGLNFGHSGIDSVDLDLDAESRVVRRMVVGRVMNGQPFATVTYTLAETDARDPGEYRLEGHLSERSEIFTREHQPERRAELLARWFAPQGGRRLLPQNAAPNPASPSPGKPLSDSPPGPSGSPSKGPAR